MSTLSEWFGFRAQVPAGELPEIFPLPVSSVDFVKTDIVGIYSKILTDVLERTHGLSDDQANLMWDNCVKSNSSEGLVTRLARAMADKQDLFMVYDKATKVLRPATGSEEQQIRDDYTKQAESTVGVFISFKNLTRSDMVKFYIGIEYLTVASLFKSMNLSKAVQIKISDLRKSVSLADEADAKTQAKEIAESLSKGKDVMLDAKDEVATSKPELTAVQEAVLFTAQKMSFYLNMPDSYFTGEQTAGMGTTGENDMRAVERGLKSYYFSVIKPAVESIFGIKVTYKSQDTRQILSSMEVLKTFSLTEDTLISAENKRKIMNGLLGLEEDAQGDPAPKPQPALPAPAPAPKPPAK